MIRVERIYAYDGDYSVGFEKDKDYEISAGELVALLEKKAVMIFTNMDGNFVLCTDSHHWRFRQR